IHLPLLVPRFSFSCYGDLRDLHSFPTRRSSDLGEGSAHDHDVRQPKEQPQLAQSVGQIDVGLVADRLALTAPGEAVAVVAQGLRSEEHTSELQSRENLVCRLLLEKKKKRSTAIR